MKVLFISNLYPNSCQMTRAVFNRQKLACLKGLCEIRIVAPVQSFPFKPLFDKKIKRIPSREIIDNMKVYHPGVFYFPGIFRFTHGLSYYLSIRSFIRNIYKDFKFDVIYSSWAYPDGFAAMKLAALTGKPFIVEALGSDINIYAGTFLRGRIITDVLRSANKVVAASRALKDKMVKLGVAEDKISVAYIGIDHDLLYPMARDEARERLGMAYRGKVILFIGNLVKVKGIQFLLEAAKILDHRDWKLVIVGEGGLEKSIRKMIGRLGLAERVEMAGPSAHDKIPLWINASDLLCLPSLSEGVPNVVLEAMACGVPVVATDVGGTPEIVEDGRTGFLVGPGDAGALAGKIDRAFRADWDRGYIRGRAARFSWDSTADDIYRSLKSCTEVA